MSDKFEEVREAGRQWARKNIDVDDIPVALCRETLRLFLEGMEEERAKTSNDVDVEVNVKIRRELT